MRNLITISALVPVLMLTGCSQIPTYEKPKVELPTQSSWNHLQPKVGNQLNLNEQAWWNQLSGDDTLAKLIKEALIHNSDIALAQLNLQQARSVSNQSKAAQYPELSSSGSLGRSKNSLNEYPVGSEYTYGAFSLGGLLSYEIDLWGKNDALKQQAQANLKATEADQKTIKLSVTAAVAQAYLNLMALNQNVHIAQNTVESRQGALQLRQTQLKYGSVTPLYVHQAESELASVEISLQQQQQQRDLQLHALSVLVGQSPKALTQMTASSFKTKDLNSLNSLPIPKGLPSDLLERRPDIIAMEQKLIAGNANIGAAKAALYPSISLSGLFGFSSEALNELFTDDSVSWSTSAAINAPIFDYGKRQSQVQITKAQKQALVIQYQQTIRTAFKEVLDALTNLKGSSQQLAAQQRQVAALKQILDLSQKRFDAGYSSYLEVLDAQRNLFNAEINSVNLKLAHSTALVNLYKALGGNWQEPKLYT
ncbi:efflux transporter outer membrane subunit [Thiomicrorhabdus sp. Milos-T2]|uniref:efflux transporter outer membrane subunit n=1 Tax=Thiomicrorhabdus sp. Milos-T2 TaxID=90814 RepID=UPI000494098E|nr:efflux transporter outer membrane subunit [Thiomicrorhabdus sp. Milos-T2]